MNMALNHTYFTRFAYMQFVIHRQKEIKDANERQEQKWLRDAGCFEASSFVEVVNATNSSYNRMFQYKIVNRITATNKYLRMINVKESENCTFCNAKPETIAHLSAP